MPALMFKLTVGLLLCLVSSVALAAPASKALVVVMDGNDRDARREIYDAIARDLRIEPPDDLNAALADEGVAGPLGEALANPRTRKPTISSVRRALRAIDAPAVLCVRVKRKGTTREVFAVAILSTQAGPLIEENFNLSPGERASGQLVPLLTASLPELVRSQQRSAEATPAPGRAPAQASLPPKRPTEKKAALEEKEKEEETPVAAPSADGSERDHVARGNPVDTSSRVDASNATWIGHVGLELVRRDLQYSDPWAGRLRPHLAPGIGAYSVALELYPGASTGTQFVKDIGLVARFSDSLPFESAAPDGQTASGRFRRYAVGARWRIQAGDKKESPLIVPEVTYGMWQVAFTGADQVVDEAPSVAYSHIRAGVGGRFPFGPFSLVGGVGYMMISSAGKYTDRFPKATVGAVDAAIGGTWAVASFVELKLAVTYARFFSSANPEPGAPYVAGGALDQYVMTSVGASTAFR
jgi:hypothetical protein